MRPTPSTMLQQNNNNNYPCLNVSGSTREMLQKCSRASLPFPSRLELGLGDLPLIRGLRAWALCSKNRRKAGGLLEAPTAPPPGGRGGKTSCPKPADVYLSGDWGRMGYGMPLGLDARQAGIGALVTVATLKTSEGSGKTQTQCLFLRTEKGSCLYTTAKPGSGVTSGAASSVVGGWLRGKTVGGGGGGGSTARRRDQGPTPQTAQTGARVRVRSGRRWRKSCNVAGREKPGVSRERQQDPAAEITLEERQEERDKGGPNNKQFPSPQQDTRRARQEKEGALRSPRCCHNASPPKSCSLCAIRAQNECQEGGETPIRGAPSRLNIEVKGVKTERRDDEKEEEKGGRGGICTVKEAESNEELKTQTSPSKYQEDTHAEVMKTHTNDSSQTTGDFASWCNGEPAEQQPCEEILGYVNRISHQSEENMESVDYKEADGSISQTPISVSVDSAVHPEPSTAVEGSTCTSDAGTCGVLRGQERSKGEHHLEEGGNCDPDPDLHRSEPKELHCVTDENNTVFFCKNEETDGLTPTLASSIFESDGRITTENEMHFLRRELPWDSREADLQDEQTIEQRVNREEEEAEAGNICGREGTFNEHGDREDDGEGQTGDAVNDDCVLRLKKSEGEEKEEDGEEEECGQTGFQDVEANVPTSTQVINVASADPFTSLANPAPSLSPLGAMATSLPCTEEEEEEEEEERVGGVTAGDGGQGEKRRECGEKEEEQWGSTVATEEDKREEEEEEEEEDEFGVFMQAEGERAWSEGSTMSASVPCGSRESVALGNHAITTDSAHWSPGWTDGSSHQSDNSWTAFPQDASTGCRDAVGQWWPTSAVEENRDRILTNQSLASVFAAAFPSLPGSASGDLDSVPTLTQLLGGDGSQDQGPLDSFHDLNKMIHQRYKRANGVSRDLLLKTLHLEQPHTESRPAPRTASRRLSPGLPSANQHAQNAAAKRRLSYDYNRNILE